MENEEVLVADESDAPARVEASQALFQAGLTKRMMTLEDNPNLRTPFDHGWRRELVQRASADDGRAAGGGGGIRADAYYFSPQGKKLRSIKETEAYLKQSGSPLDVVCFSFSRHLLGVGPPLEKLRKARPMGPAPVPAVTATAGRKTAAAATAGKKAAAAKKIQRKKRTITIGGASSVIKLPSPASANSQKIQRKHSLMEKSRKAFAFKAMELKKKMPVFQSEAAKLKPATVALKQRGRLPGLGSTAAAAAAAGDRDRVLLRRPWLLAEVDERGGVCCRQPPDSAVTSEYFRLVGATAAPHTADSVLIGRARQSAPCSLFCFVESPLSQLALPSTQCLICRCLSHPVCVGLEDSKLTSFVCVDCYAGVGLGRGFDGLGDSVDGDSGSGSESDGDGDSVEELMIPGPAPPLLLGGPRFGAPPPPAFGVKRPRGRPRLSGPRQPRPGVVRGAYARRRGLGGGRGSRGARFVAGVPRLAGPGLLLSGAAVPASPAAPDGQSRETAAQPARVGQTNQTAAPAPAPAAAAAPAPAAATADLPAKKRSWKDP